MNGQPDHPSEERIGASAEVPRPDEKSHERVRGASFREVYVPVRRRERRLGVPQCQEAAIDNDIGSARGRVERKRSRKRKQGCHLRVLAVSTMRAARRIARRLDEGAPSRGREKEPKTTATDIARTRTMCKRANSIRDGELPGWSSIPRRGEDLSGAGSPRVDTRRDPEPRLIQRRTRRISGVPAPRNPMDGTL